MVRPKVTGEQLAQLDNQDPFAPAVWRSPVHRTPEAVIWVVQLVRLIARIVRFVVRHPVADLAAGAVAVTWIKEGWPGLAVLADAAGTVLAALWLFWPVLFARWVAGPLRSRWRWLSYRRRWQPVMIIAGLAPSYRGQASVPVLGTVTATGCTDRVAVRLVSGQSPNDFSDRAEAIAHGFRAYLCRVRTAAPGMVVLELVRRDALAAPMAALAIPDVSDLRALFVGKREDGAAFSIRLQGTHLLIAGATGAGKGSYLWSMVRAMLPAMAAGLVRVQACDPKLMELAFGRALFDAYGRYAADPADIADLLEDAVSDMQARARRFAGKRATTRPPGNSRSS